MANIDALNIYVQKILPLVYDDSLSYYELLSKVVAKINEIVPIVNVTDGTIKNYVDVYIQSLVDDGTLEGMINDELLSDIRSQADTNTADIETLKQAVETIPDISEIESRVATVEAASAKNTTAIATNTADISANTSDIAELKTLVDGIDASTPFYIFVGDSYAEGYSPDGTTTPWCTHVKNLLGLSDGGYKIICLGGTGFAAGDKTFEEQLAEYADTLTEAELSRKTKIVVCGGYNDTDNDATWDGVESFIQYARDTFTNSNVYVGMVAYGLTTRGSNLMRTLYAYQSASRTRTGHYLSGVEYALHNQNLLSSDAFHPNDAGQYAIAQHVYNALTTGCTHVTYPFEECDLVFDDNVSAHSGNIGSYMSDNMSTLMIENFEVSFSENVSITTNGKQALCTVDLNGGGGAALYGCDISNRQVYGWIRDKTNSVTRACAMNIQLQAGKIKFMPWCFDSSGTAYTVEISQFGISLGCYNYNSIKQE